MGVGAAAFATIVSQTVSAILAFAKLTRSKEEWAVHWNEVRFDAPSLKAVVVQGLPSGIQNSVISIANVIVQSNINSFGAQAMAGCGAYSKVEGFAFLPVTCFSMALATFVSQNVGAGQPDRVRKGMKFGTLCSVLMAEIVGVGIYTLSPWLIGAFSREPGCHRVRCAAGPHGGAVLLPAGLQPLLCRHPARAGAAGRADDGHADDLVCAAHHLYHYHTAFYPRHQCGVLGLPADMEHLLGAVCVVHPALPDPTAGRRCPASMHKQGIKSTPVSAWVTRIRGTFIF